ncbi:MAG: hypothetical protein ABWY02_04400 [Telluria sp.]
MTAKIGTSLRLALVAVMLAACGSTTTVPPAGLADCGPCCDKNPAAEAAGKQGISAANPNNPYIHKDTFANVAVNEGTVLYSLTPGIPPGFAVTEDTLREARGVVARYYALVQVTTDPGEEPTGVPRKLRENVRAFHVTAPICAARGIAQANAQFGSGGGTQYYVSPSDVDKLRPGAIMPISQWNNVTN